MSLELQERLQTGLEALDLHLTLQQQQSLIDYLYLLQKWNRHFNLSAIRDIDDMLVLHIFDSLTLCRFLSGNEILDVGTGAGLPGIPLAICFPDKHFCLLDSNGKKTRFCRQAIMELKIHNADVVQTRIETYEPEIAPELVLTRAFAALPDMLKLMQSLLSESTRLLAMKAEVRETEINVLDKLGFELEQTLVKVPGLQAQRNILLIKTKI